MFEIHLIETGYIMADGGAMFGAIPKRAWQRKYNSDKDNLCKLAMRCALAVSGNRKVLIDLGLGNQNTIQAAYYAPHDIKEIDAELRILGYSNSDITDVVLTHLHFDHCGYATFRDEQNHIVPSFPNARYWLSRKQWINLLDPNLLEKDSLSQDSILPIYDAGLLHIIDEDSHLDDGFEVRLFDGHSEGQMIPFIQTMNGTFVFASDVVPTASHVALEWISAYDINALASLHAKARLLEEAVTNDYTLIYYHDAMHAMSKVKRINDNFKASI